MTRYLSSLASLLAVGITSAQTSPPAIEPVAVVDAKSYSRIIDNSEDTLVSLIISAARRYAEMYTGRSFITQSWKLTLDSFPGRMTQLGVRYGVPYSQPGNAVLLDFGTVQSIDAITYTAMDGTTQTMPIANYIADLSGCPARVTPIFGQIWPITMPQIASANIAYTAGYGVTAASVPEGIRQWIMLRTSTLLENREAVAIVVRGKVQELPYIDSLLDPFRCILA